jgi:hypothetical protein
MISLSTDMIRRVHHRHSIRQLDELIIQVMLAAGKLERDLLLPGHPGSAPGVKKDAPQCRPSIGQKLCRISRVSHALADQKAH